MIKHISLLAILSLPLASCDDGTPAHDHGTTGHVLYLEGDAPRGLEFFSATCEAADCHGAGGTSGPAPDLSTNVPSHDDMQLASVIRNGTEQMPAQAPVLNDQAIADVMASLREMFP